METVETYLSVAETAEKWKISERSVRNYCAQGRVVGAVQNGGRWIIAENAEKPERKQRFVAPKMDLASRLKDEKDSRLPNGIYHRVQIELTYNSNHMEGSRLTHDQTRFIFETNTVGVGETERLNVDDIIETANHFRCIDLVIDRANFQLTEAMIKQLHGVLKTGTSDSRKNWFAVGDYKRLPNEVGGCETVRPEEVAAAMKRLLRSYHASKEKTFEEIVEFHYEFEKIHPFQDGNGRVGRLILFKECLRNGITPFIIEEDLKAEYYRGLQEWRRERGYLLDTCRTAQDRFQAVLDRFGIR